MPGTVEIDSSGMRQDPGFRLGYEFPEVLEAVVELASPSPAAGRAERATSAANRQHPFPASSLPSYRIPREAPLIIALIGMARELHMHVNLRLYDRAEGAAYDLWDSAREPAGSFPDIASAEVSGRARRGDLYLDIASARTRDHRLLHVLLH